MLLAARTAADASKVFLLHFGLPSLPFFSSLKTFVFLIINTIISMKEVLACCALLGGAPPAPGGVFRSCCSFVLIILACFCPSHLPGDKALKFYSSPSVILHHRLPFSLFQCVWIAGVLHVAPFVSSCCCCSHMN